MFLYHAILLLLFTTIHADNFQNILKAIEGTSEGKNVLSGLPAQTIVNLAQRPLEAGEFICYLIDGNIAGMYTQTV